MKILQIIPSLNPAQGGTVQAVLHLAGGLRDLGHHVEIVCLDEPRSPWLELCSVACHALGPTHGRYAYSARFASWLQDQHHRFDIVVINGLWQYSGYASWRILRRTKVPYVVLPHGMLDAWFKRRYPLKHLKKWLYWPWAEYRVLRDAKAVVFTSEEERLSSRTSFWLYRAHERVVPLGIPPPPACEQSQRQEFLAVFPHLATTRNLIYLGRIHEKKGCDLLIRAFAEVAKTQIDVHLIMTGPDQDGWRPRLELLAEQSGVAHRITWTGMLQRPAIWGALRCAEAFILPSHQENFGIAVVEALACGVPVLISDKVNIWREIVGDGAGMAASDDLTGIRSLLIRWLAYSVKEREGMALAAKHCFSRRFAIARAASAMIDCYQAQDHGSPGSDPHIPLR